MAFGRLGEQREPMAEMNIIPLVDVMLVLLVVFIVTAPVITHSVNVKLPTADASPQDERPDSLTISLDAAGQLYLADEPVRATRLESRLEQAMSENPELVVYLRADESTPYGRVAETMAKARQAGVERLGFVSRPE
ncbi:biopolymer transporter ExbD [Guyparkeria hydrothermalis]|uniref:ExbD/TolR family protein n=1 Tax=Guyparkeria hydrothermalis TaxID=923 RepID=UPI0020215EFF|nr:biopolymer transporter ExbD [Guyparkeria hydrothermalis]MCL7744393.1 biopolymer transporter ExbD [Guyparkeria hydrothermalis]